MTILGLIYYVLLFALFLSTPPVYAHPVKYHASVGTQAGTLKAGEIPEILSYHVHVVYMIHNGKHHVDDALALRDKARSHFLPYTNDTVCAGDFDVEPLRPDDEYPEGGRYDNGRLCFIKDHDFSTTLEGGPFPVGEWSMFVPVGYLDIILPWFSQNRGTFSVLIHPNTGYEYEDHSIWSFWNGIPWPLNMDIFTPLTRTADFNQVRGNEGNPTCRDKGAVCGDFGEWVGSTGCCEDLACGCDGEVCTCN